MERSKVIAGGITTVKFPSDGELHSRLNARVRGGVTEPVMPRSVIGALRDDYDAVFVHRGEDYENWLGVKNNAVYLNVRVGDAPLIAVGSPLGEIVSLEQLGNVLVVVTSSDIYYTLYKDDAYGTLRTFPALPAASVRTYELKRERYSLDDLGYVDDTWTDENNYAFTPSFLNSVIGMYRERNAEGGFAYDAFLLRYAIRLHDGSLVRHSPPLLICPDYKMFAEWPKDGENDAGNNNPPDCVFPMLLNVIDTNEDDGSEYGSWRIIRRTDGGLTHAYFYPYGAELQGNFSSLAAHVDMIRSIDVFISLPLGFFSAEGSVHLVPTTRKGHGRPDKSYIAPGENSILKNIGDVSHFYLVKSIPVSESLGTNTVIGLFDGKEAWHLSNPETLAQQEELGGDLLGHNHFGGNVSMVYNNRLHVADIQTTLFNGFDARFFQLLNPAYNGIDYESLNVGWQSLIIEVEISVEEGKRKLQQRVSRVSMYSLWLDSGAVFLNGYISYPDSRATKLRVIAENGSTWYKLFECDLKAHPLLDMAYHVVPGNTPSPIIGKNAGIIPRETATEVTERRENLIRVSGDHNPVSFSSLHAYSAGNGQILAMAANVMAVSDRNYGTQPLFVFSTDGIWTLTVGDGSVLYSSLVAPTSLLVAISPVVCSIPAGVVFATDRGIALINSSGATLLTPGLFEDEPELLLSGQPVIDGLTDVARCPSFLDFIRGITTMAHDPLNDELLLVNDDYSFIHVIELSTGYSYRSTELSRRFVKNVYPKMFGFYTTDQMMSTSPLVDFLLDGGDFNDMMLITRPLSFSIPDRKQMGRLIARGLFYSSGGEHALALYGSNDGIHFRFISGRVYRDGHVDGDLGLLSSSSFRWHVVVFSGRFGRGSFLSFLDAQVKKRELNNKMR